MEVFILPEHAKRCQRWYNEQMIVHNGKVSSHLAGNDYADSGFDLYIPCNTKHDEGKWVFPPNATVRVPLGIKIVNRVSADDKLPNCLSVGNTHPYYIYARSSISKTPLRLANNQGIIDAGYRGELMIALDNISSTSFELEPGTRLVQVCSPNLEPFKVSLVEHDFETTERGSGGFGSTGT